MHARAESVDAVIVLCGAGPRSTESALEHIAAVDDASQGVPMRQVQTHKPPNIPCHVCEDCAPRNFPPNVHTKRCTTAISGA